MILNIIFIIIGFALLIKGADYLVDGASNIAKKFNIPEIVIGLTIVAIGTSMPELVVSSKSALAGHSDLALGNVIGSNVANLFLILGICSIIKPLIFKKETKFIENPFTIFVTGLLFFLCINSNNSQITKLEGIVLLSVCAIFIIYNIIMARKGNEYDGVVEIRQDNNINVIKSIIYVILGIVGLKLGGDFVVDNCVNIAEILGISEKMIGLTIVAFSTSLPELITSITATRKGEVDMAIGNIVGSQIFNILLIIGISAFLSPISYSTLYNKDFIILLTGNILFALYPFIGEKNKMTKNNGIIFVIIYFIYMTNMIMTNI